MRPPLLDSLYISLYIIKSMILVICPLKIELKNLKEAFLRLGYKLENKASHTKVIATNLCLAQGGHGKVNFAINTLSLIKSLKPELVICAGASGGLPGATLLDVVIGLKTIEHDYKQAFTTDASLPSFPGSVKYLEVLKENTQAIIASGDEDVVSLARAKEIQKLTKAQCVAWEGAGGAKACSHTNTDFLEIRFISDMCNENTVSDFKANLEKGMNKIANTLVKIIKN